MSDPRDDRPAEGGPTGIDTTEAAGSGDAPAGGRESEEHPPWHEPEPDQTRSIQAGPRPRPDGGRPADSPSGPRPRPEPRRHHETEDAEDAEETVGPGGGRSDAGAETRTLGRDHAASDTVPTASRFDREPPPPPPPGPSSSPASQAGTAQQERDRYRQVVAEVERYLGLGYGLLGLVGYASAGKTHAAKAFTHLLPELSPDVRAALRERLSPTASAADVFMLPYHGRGEGDPDRTVFLDAGGELYARLRENDWDLLPESSALLHALGQARGLFFLIDLHPGHFAASGKRQGMSADEEARVERGHEAHAEQEFVDLVLLFLRALAASGGDVRPVVERCAAAPSVDKALEEFRVKTPKLDIPVMVLFSKADRWVEAQLQVAPGESLAPHRSPVGVAPFVARHLPYLFSAVRAQARRFHFDFVQSYVEVERARVGGVDREPVWEHEGVPLSVGLLPALEMVLRTKPARGRFGRLLQKLEIDTGTALGLHRLLHRDLWRGAAP